MTKKPSGASPGEDLRARAERLLAAKGEAEEKTPWQDVQTLVHELQVHQIELEMQNEELRRTNYELEELHFKYAGLYDFAPVGYFSLDQKGLILELNLTGARLLGVQRDRLLSSPFFLLVASADRAVFHTYLEKIFNSVTKQTCEIQTEPRGSVPFYASLEGLSVRADQGQITQCRTMVADITARKQERDALELEKRNESLRKALGKTVLAFPSAAWEPE
ncbi:MAG: PAS domain-containing protein [Proteobacteria bacterium]|nr:PAS domain-containing protein [Pseudomonadota bacterium]MBU4353737.1 PAS domain-containing protein [Pseudomonadota bacterium]